MPASPRQPAQHECLVPHSPAFPAHEWRLESEADRQTMKVSGAVEVNAPEAIGAPARARDFRWNPVEMPFFWLKVSLPPAGRHRRQAREHS
ncbi:hypothetical protein [Burkholderia plantarii]|uniref:hypothetical protein n=1 Tax=Burkholderia plantarii TaxID=41899 RepID=UPI0018DDB3E8|nr:hypothetical protein [Burkholderia plantarii]MBI0331151.1 hypothetical protein [Burkholderia plantarii]